MMSPVSVIWFQFALCAILIGVAGYQLSLYGDVIARRTGMSGSWVGLALLATVTSLPELATGISSVTVANAPNLAVGDALGSCVVNLVFLVVIDTLFRKEPLWPRAGQGHVLAAAFGVLMLGFTLVSLLMSQVTPPQASVLSSVLTPLGFGLTTLVLLGLYLVAMRTVFAYERDHAVPKTATLDDQLPTLRTALIRFAIAAFVVAGAGVWLPFVATDLANVMAWNKSFVGSLFVALATSLPELAVTLSALRLGALDMAIGNLLGSNLFNVLIIAVDDLFYRPGVLLANVSPVHAVTAASAITMTGLALVGLFFKPGGRVLRAMSWISLGLVCMYLLNTYVLFLFGE
ncbi:sodium:calcium antiporter [Rhodoferax fermentans]|uniref:Cation transporter n=1 Tax=Rhodoferax fermentans TaxID=28066 RepID=A0A1T1AWF6_RHOFE|nr:sodium:calcium antiporter [Rhodoferax fermentans]MBK1685649.1 cation transporter [Rhodoferax fermentans]OOV08387.1 cation transporter [Rhodoferax fermentans]